MVPEAFGTVIVVCPDKCRHENSWCSPQSSPHLIQFITYSSTEYMTDNKIKINLIIERMFLYFCNFVGVRFTKRKLHFQSIS